MFKGPYTKSNNNTMDRGRRWNKKINDAIEGYVGLDGAEYLDMNRHILIGLHALSWSKRPARCNWALEIMFLP